MLAITEFTQKHKLFYGKTSGTDKGENEGSHSLTNVIATGLSILDDLKSGSTRNICCPHLTYIEEPKILILEYVLPHATLSLHRAQIP